VAVAVGTDGGPRQAYSRRMSHPRSRIEASARTPYRARREAAFRISRLRGLDQHALDWSAVRERRGPQPLLVMVHGWMDVAASFQFMVDALADDRRCVALDWRGFGRTVSGADTFWFADYLGDLDAWLDQLCPDGPVDLLGHSMGGNVAMMYAGVRPQRVRRLINLEGFGMPSTRPAQAPERLARWLDELRTPMALRDYASLDEVADRLLANNALLTPEKAAWLAPHWSAPRIGADGSTRWHILGEAAHKRVNPVLYRVDEVLATWARITAPLLWVDGDRTDVAKWWGQRFPRSEFDERLKAVPRVEKHTLSPCGHMLHHDQPEVLAGLVEAFLSRPDDAA
jgi:pimeloyl-ACP methyl ester carboxylesterase